ncbi:uncharacterized protein DS421_14g468380 [Arachis hypogaea]|nr:uncharacterized protein DS421_14g468380 [Arachis hypogaea]
MAQIWKYFACQGRQQLQGQQRLVDQTLQQAALVEQDGKRTACHRRQLQQVDGTRNWKRQGRTKW